MDQIDLNIDIPLMVEDQNETIVYMDDPDEEEVKESIMFKDNDALIINDSNEALLINSDSLNETIFNNNMIKGETFMMGKADENDETLILDDKTEDIIIGDSSSDKDEVNICNEILTNEIGEKNSLKNENTVLIQTAEGSQLFVNGEMVQLFDGDLIDNSKSNENDVCAPIKLFNSNVIYVVPSTVLGSVNDSDNSNQCVKINDIVLNTEERTEKNKGFHCSYKNCNKSYSSFHHLKVHLRAHTGDRPFRCSVEGCNKAFSTGFGLKTHFRTHNGERPYTCSHDNCEKGFKTSGDLLKHMRTHTGERPFLCPIPNCGRSFTTCNICKVHVRTHTGERPYKCTYPNCNKTFASVTNQRNHIRIHSGEKPYVCRVEKCGRRFTEYSSLYKHNMVHQQQPHLCLVCGKTYRQSSGLMMHMKSVHCKRDDSFWMLDKSPTEDITQDEPSSIFLVDNMPLVTLEDGVLEDPLFSELRETTPLNV